MGQVMPDPSHRVRALVDAHLGRWIARSRAAEAGIAGMPRRRSRSWRRCTSTCSGRPSLAAGDPQPRPRRSTGCGCSSTRAACASRSATGRSPITSKRWWPSERWTARRRSSCRARTASRDAAPPVDRRRPARVRGRSCARRGRRGRGADALAMAIGLGPRPGRGRRTLRRAPGRCWSSADWSGGLGRRRRPASASTAPWPCSTRCRRQRGRPRRGRRSTASDAVAAPATTLTPAEARVVELIAAGLTNRAVADRLVLSPKTVEAHLARAYAKLGVRSRAELGRRIAPAGDGPREARRPRVVGNCRMLAVLAGAASWRTWHPTVRPAPPASLRTFLAERYRAGTSRELGAARGRGGPRGGDRAVRSKGRPVTLIGSLLVPGRRDGLLAVRRGVVRRRRRGRGANQPTVRPDFRGRADHRRRASRIGS